MINVLLNLTRHPRLSHLSSIILLSSFILFAEQFLKVPSNANFFVLMGNLTFASFLMTSSFNQANEYILTTPSDKHHLLSCLPLDFLKISLNFMLLSLNLILLSILSLSESSNYLLVSPYAIFIVIFMIWNSIEFRRVTLKIFISFVRLDSSKTVSFASVMVADVWTSFSRVEIFGSNAIRAELKFFLTCVPYIIRMKQCFFDRINFDKSQKRILSSINFVKYLALLTCIVLNSIYNITWGINFIFIFSGSVILAAATWDLFVDWGYSNRDMRKKHGMKLIIWSILNACLRLLPLSRLEASSGPDSLLLNGLETIRRIVWIYWRYLNHISNIEN